MAKRKRMTLLVTVSVPETMSAPDARREVKTLISQQCNWSADPGDVKAISVESAAWVEKLKRGDSLALRAINIGRT